MSARRYEGFFLVDNGRASQQWEETVAAIENLLKKHGGQVVKTMRWEERKLEYEVKGHRRGTYVLSYFDIEPTAVADLRRDLNIFEVVLRGTISCQVGKLLEGPQDLFADGASDAPPPSEVAVVSEPINPIEL